MADVERKDIEYQEIQHTKYYFHDERLPGLNQKVDTEIQDRKDADKVLQDNINKEATRRDMEDKTLKQQIDTETQNRENADNALDSKISDETEARINADGQLQENINTEKSDRKNADNDLNQKITDEADARTQADEKLQDDLEKEEETREKADTSLTNRVAEMETGVSNLADKAVTNVSMTDDNGTYTIKQTINGQEKDVGTIVTEQNNPVVEVKDTVTENNTDGYDQHSLSETLSDGTSNDVEQFYLAQKQFIGEVANPNGTISKKYIDQKGSISSETGLYPMSQPSRKQSHGLSLLTFTNAFGRDVNVLGGMLGKTTIDIHIPKQEPLTFYDAKNINFSGIGSSEWAGVINSMNDIAIITSHPTTDHQETKYFGIGIAYNAGSYANQIDLKIFTLMDNRTDEDIETTDGLHLAILEFIDVT